MRTKNVASLTIDKEVLKDAKTILAKEGLKLSTFVEMVLRTLVNSEKLTMREVYEDLGKNMVAITKESKKKKKE